MSEQLTPEEVALLIKARKILKEKGLSKDIDVKGICEAAGISRKTGYQWVKKGGADNKDEAALEEMCRLKAECEELKERLRCSEIENEGHKLAWKIHHVDEWLASKKNSARKGTKKKR